MRYRYCACNLLRCAYVDPVKLYQEYDLWEKYDFFHVALPPPVQALA